MPDAEIRQRPPLVSSARSGPRHRKLSESPTPARDRLLSPAWLLSTLLKQKKNSFDTRELIFIATVTQVTPNPLDRAGNEAPSPTSSIKRL
ncbi:hypothetical protein TNCV_3594941 [Trichonephila clavipes]|nr:hypothetical protein TNCV_3594941 [Trichonephila clavipes]